MPQHLRVLNSLSYDELDWHPPHLYWDLSPSELYLEYVRTHLIHAVFPEFHNTLSYPDKKRKLDQIVYEMQRDFEWWQNKPAKKYEVEDTSRNKGNTHGGNSEKSEGLKNLTQKLRVIGIVNIPLIHQVIEQNQRA